MKAPRLQSRAALGALVLAAAAALALVYSVITKASALGDAVEIALAPEMPRDLIEATRGPRAESSSRASAPRRSMRRCRSPRRDRGGAAVQSRRRVDERAAARAPLPHPGRLLRSRLRTGRGSPGGRPGRPQPRPPPAFPNSVCGVVYDGSSRSTGCQFSFTCDGSLRRPPSAAAWAAAERIARGPVGPGRLGGRHRDPLSCQLRRALLGAAADQAAPGRRAYLLHLARRLGPECRLQQPLCRRRGVYLPQPGAELTDVAAAALPVDPTDRRAPADVGGRLDVTKGWTLSIPAPEESRGSYAAALGRQAAASAAAAQSPAAVSNVSGTE